MRPEKTLIVSDIREKLQASPYLLVVDFTGMKVPHFENLRIRLADAGARMSVVRNTFLRIAASELQMPELSESLAGQTAMVTGDTDICAGYVSEGESRISCQPFDETSPSVFWFEYRNTPAGEYTAVSEVYQHAHLRTRAAQPFRVISVE
jgi:hypothetical protein